MLSIKRMSEHEINAVAQLAFKLWPDADLQELTAEFADLLSSPRDAVFVAKENEMAIGFAHVSLRYEFVEGTSSAPIGYLEGIFVEATWRKRGIARQLVQHCEQWAREKGCHEFASDAELHNVDSQKFHEKAGFKEINRIVCYAKVLNS